MNQMETVIEQILEDQFGLWDKYGDYLMDRGHLICNGNDLVNLMEDQTDIEEFAQHVIDNKLVQ